SPVRREPGAGDPGFGPSQGDAGRDQRCPADGIRYAQAEARSMIGPAHHVGIAVKSLKEALEGYRRLGLEPDFTEEVPSQGVRVAFLRTAAVRVALLESLQPDGLIARFIERRGDDLHPPAFAR